MLVTLQPGTFRDGQSPKVLNDHDLKRLCDRAAIPVSEPDEREVLDELTDVLKWMGRYPEPRTYRDFMPRKQPDGTTMWRAPGICTSVSNVVRTGASLTFERLFDRLAAYCRVVVAGQVMEMDGL